MSTITTNAIVLRHANYRENDRMLTLFSPTLGRMDVLCRGCRKQKSPLMAASELFCVGEYVLYQSKERIGVTACSVQDSYYALREDVDRLTHGALYLELCEAVVQPGEGNERLFLFLLRTLAHLCYGKAEPSRVSAVFLMGFCSLIGFRPQVKACMDCGEILPQENRMAYCSAEAGGFLCARCAMNVQSTAQLPRLDAQAVRYMQDIMRRGLESLDDVQELPAGVLRSLLLYAGAHVERTIKSAKLLG